MQARKKPVRYPSHPIISMTAGWVVAAVLVLLSPSVEGTEYMGIWKVDAEGDGIALDIPDNGLDGACISLSGSGENSGSFRIERQIVRGRFQQLSVEVNGALPPEALDIALLMDGEVVWHASPGAYEQQPVSAELDGNEFVIEAKSGGDGLEPWEMTFCNMELTAEQFSLRFTSDCAGFDFHRDSGTLRIVVDEDWSALGRMMAGGSRFSNLLICPVTPGPD